MISASDRMQMKRREATLTIHCVSYGKPVTTAGPNERAVFIPAPVNWTAHLSHKNEKICYTVTSGECKNNKQTHKWHTNSVKPIPTYSGANMRTETTSQSEMSDSPERTALCCVSLLRA